MACRDLLVFLERRESLEWMASLDPQEKEETQVSVSGVRGDISPYTVTVF